MKDTVGRDLNTTTGRQVSAEIAFIESWFDKIALKTELERRKRQEEEDEEAARQLNFKEHEVNGGLLEWYFSTLPKILMEVAVATTNVR